MHNELPPLLVLTEECRAAAEQISQAWGLSITQTSPNSGLVLVLDNDGLRLANVEEPKSAGVQVDFADPAIQYRRNHGGGKQEAIAKAVGLKGKQSLRVLDATAGLGRDAFVLACLGCELTLLERSPVVAALLQDGLSRAANHPELGQWLPQQMQLLPGNSIQQLAQWPQDAPQVIYLDPMFPHRKKSAMVKKEMRWFQTLLGHDPDADHLLPPALALATERVVVKRPASAPLLNQTPCTMSITSKKHRFDVYITKK